MKDDFLTAIAENVKSLRQRRNLSLEKTAKICDLSKSMVAQIERCEVNPTITTLEKIAVGFDVSIPDLLYKSKPKILIFPKDKFETTSSYDGKINIFKVLQFDTDKRFEHRIIEIDTNGNSDTNSSPENTQTYITIFKGNISITLNEKTYDLSAGDMITFQSNINYSLFNPSKKSCRLSVIIHYPIDYIT
ncbi:MAG: helix-turn-helix domain-containing protein [Clostridiales bacterium]|nr:helix-turn-helix domain-containing protein [Clostridiales bacterium]